jgi:GDP-6-deoxy-D-talose 4-dehydrogenase
MRVLVTGALGFTGRYVAAELARRGHEAIGLEADLLNADALRREVQATLPDATIHLAARAFVDSSDFNAFYGVNQVGTFNLLDALVDAAPGSTVLLASSAQVYGAAASGLLNEEQPLHPSNHYALSKAFMEQGAMLWADRLRLLVARPFNYTGVGQEERYLVSKIVAHFRRRDPVIELGNLHVLRDFGDVRAVADAYVGLVEASDLPVATYNVASGVLSSIGDIVEHLTQHTGHRIKVRVNPAFVRANDVAELGGDATLLHAALPHWAPRPLTDTLNWMLAA